MDVYVARQPIFDLKKRIFGYELLFRDGLTNAFPDIDGDTATTRLISNTFFSIGLEPLSGGKKVLINFTQELLAQKVPALLPHERVIIEILEDVEPIEPVIAACRDMRRQGFTIALDDFLFRPDLKELIRLANIIKIDFRQSTPDETRDLVRRLGQLPLTFLAEKIETYDEFASAQEMGFTYFQGYFFSRPEILSSRGLTASKLTLLRIVGEVNKESFDLDQLEELIQLDLALSYKLLKYINSAYFRRITEISSIRQAIVLLGEKETRKFVSVIAAAELSMGKPDELIRTSIVRAKFCELIGPHQDASERFLMGLFSLIDAMLDSPMAAILAELPLSDPIKNALSGGNGELARFLELAVSYDTGDWRACQRICQALSLDENSLPAHYIEAVGWANAYETV
jgi:c-di-GMP-related signal transduction protein